MMIKQFAATARLAVMLLVGGLALSGCAAYDYWQAPTYALDYRERHPIVLADNQVRLEVFPRGAFGLDKRQSADVRAFARRYARETKSKLDIVVPTAAQGRSQAVQEALSSVEGIFRAAGVSRRNIVVRDQPANHSEAPLVLSFTTMVAEVPHECGQWPFDLAAGAGDESWQNEPYWDLGCAYQANLAAQVEDPLDLVRPRQETAADTVRRVNDIRQLRDGKDPSTNYRRAPSNASASGGQ